MKNVVLDTRVLDGMIAASQGKAEKAVAETALTVQGKAAIAAPYRTGALSIGMMAEPEAPLQWLVRDSVDYGIHQEFGTYKMPAHPFLIPSVESERQPFVQRLATVAKP